MSNAGIVICSAPGKILWIGGYSVLERPNVSFVTGVDKRVFVRAVESYKTILRSEQFKINVEADFDGEKLVLKQEVPQAKFLKAAAQACLVYLKNKGVVLKKFELTTYSDPAFGIEDKAGLGGSAAVTVATVAALLELHSLKLEENKDLIFKLSQYAHSDAQGGKVGSGFDIAAATFGASSYVRFSPTFVTEHPFPASMEEKWDYELGDIPLPSDFRVVIANIVGQSASTSEMVKKVNAWKEGHAEEYKALMRELNEANQEAISALMQYNKTRDRASFEKFKQTFERGRVLTRQLGEKSGAPIETPALTALVDACMHNGAFVAKLPGAGGGDSVAAFCLNAQDEAKLKKFLSSYSNVPVKVLDLSTSNEGVRVEGGMPIQ